MFSKILIANRGEIACRVIRTARRLGMATVGVYSDADAKSLHVAMAGEAVHIGASPVAESYLKADRIIDAALKTGAQAIHPGYGFLSEAPDFVERVEAAGLVFIGPSASSIRAMGLKDAAKRLMEITGVPVVPGYHGEAQDPALLASRAIEIGFPVLIKARAGGGGKGMRRVETAGEFADALASAQREAKASFGDDKVLIEKYVEKPRHIEVQVFGDNHGNGVHLFERDCSAQRRHQKVIEEAPAPGMTPEMRVAMTHAAVKAAKAINYSGAGTIEFIVDASEGLRADRFWFMEMNTRLQVEHPMTEMVTGQDLVEWQIRVAAGELLPLTQDDIHLDGHAFEARLYAEDASRGFLPATGTLYHLRFPPEASSIRIETGVRQGDTISSFYDPMIAKIVTKGSDRKDALELLVSALAVTEVAGSTVNTAFLSALAQDEDFATGDVDTGLIARKQGALTALAEASARSKALAALRVASVDEATSNDPWASLTGYDHFGSTAKAISLGESGEISVSLTAETNGAWRAEVDEQTIRFSPTSLPEALASAVIWPGHVTVFDGAVSHTFIARDPLDEAADAYGGAGSLRAPMPGLVKLVRAKPGFKVSKGDPLLILEAMKMEHTITAPHDGTIAKIAAEGAQVADGTVLVRFEESGGN
nr:acetyl/propionyl/methylcrotonyl-CoA carboxylase subunit alpha [Mesorhizobium japonicum]